MQIITADCYSYTISHPLGGISAIPESSLSYNLNFVWACAAGNLKQDKSGYSYNYDYENRLIRIYLDANPNGVYDAGTDTLKAAFEYDALGRRIEKMDAAANTTTRYYYDDQRVVLQTVVSGGTTQKTGKTMKTTGSGPNKVSDPFNSPWNI